MSSIVEPVCPETEVVFLCEQATSPVRWTVSIIATTETTLILERTLSSSQVGNAFTFSNDPGYGFMISLTTTPSDSINSFLRVNAVRELNGAQVECAGGTGSFMAELQIRIVGEEFCKITFQ